MGRAGDFDRHKREVVECQGWNNGAEEDEQLARRCRWKGQGGCSKGCLGPDMRGAGDAHDRTGWTGTGVAHQCGLAPSKRVSAMYPASEVAVAARMHTHHAEVEGS